MVSKVFSRERSSFRVSRGDSIAVTYRVDILGGRLIDELDSGCADEGRGSTMNFGFVRDEDSAKVRMKSETVALSCVGYQIGEDVDDRSKLSKTDVKDSQESARMLHFPQ